MLCERGLSYNRIYVIPNGIDTSLFKPCENEKCVKRLRKKYRLPYPKTIFIYAGSIGAAYKIDAVLKGISHLGKKNDFMFLIVGRPTLLMTQKRILQAIERLEVKETVKVIGPLPVDEIAELQGCCDVGVIPLDDKEFWKCIITLKLFAYLASGLPVLASGPKNGELEKFLSKYEIGFFIGKPTPQRFREGFRKFLEEKSRIKSMGLRRRKIMEKFYDRYALSQKIIPIINDLIDSPTPEGA
jgi:glycosyltransferase involved in cell wall biosynthesis